MKNEAVIWMLEKIDKGLYYYQGGKLFHSNGQEVGANDSYGYRVGSVRNFGLKKQYKVHRVLFAYYHGIEELEKHEVINHKDFNRKNNTEQNLEGVSSKENVLYSKLNGRYAIKLNVDDVINIKIAIKQGVSMVELGRIYNVSPNSIQAIKMERSWKHVQLS